MRNSKEIIEKFIDKYPSGELPFPNLAVKSGHVVCGNCGKDYSLFNILGNPNNYCGNCGVRIGFPYDCFNEGGEESEEN